MMSGKSNEKRVRLGIRDDRVSERLAHVLLAGVAKDDHDDSDDEDDDHQHDTQQHQREEQQSRQSSANKGTVQGKERGAVSTGRYKSRSARTDQADGNKPEHKCRQQKQQVYDESGGGGEEEGAGVFEHGSRNRRLINAPDEGPSPSTCSFMPMHHGYSSASNAPRRSADKDEMDSNGNGYSPRRDRHSARLTPRDKSANRPNISSYQHADETTSPRRRSLTAPRSDGSNSSARRESGHDERRITAEEDLAATRRAQEARELCLAYHKARTAKKNKKLEKNQTTSGDDDDDESSDDEVEEPNFLVYETAGSKSKTCAEKRLEMAAPGASFMIRWLLCPLFMIGVALVLVSSPYGEKSPGAPGPILGSVSHPVASGRDLLHRLHKYVERNQERFAQQPGVKDFMSKESSARYGPSAESNGRL
jgi:hypothetical protein